MIIKKNSETINLHKLQEIVCTRREERRRVCEKLARWQQLDEHGEQQQDQALGVLMSLAP